MAYDYSRLAATANNLLTKFGRPATLERATNTGTPSRPNITTSRSQVTAVILDKQVFDATNQVMRVRQMAYIAPNASNAPKPNDILEDAEGRRFEIVTVSALKPAGMVFLYTADIGTA